MTVAQSTITWMRPRNILGQPKTDTFVGSRIDRLNCLCKNISLSFSHYHTLSLSTSVIFKLHFHTTHLLLLLISLEIRKLGQPEISLFRLHIGKIEK